MNYNFSHWSFKIWPLSSYEAITLPWGLYFKSPKAKVSKSLINHEKQHLKQIKQYGILGFYSRYMVYYIQGLFKYLSHQKAYLNNPFEKEARKHA